jgi:hypothetical protein
MGGKIRKVAKVTNAPDWLTVADWSGMKVFFKNRTEMMGDRR